MAVPVRTLNDGTQMPIIGFGTFPLRDNDGYTAILSALEAGYRIVDTAVNYRNEVEAGRAVRDFLQQSGTPREEIVVQTKIPGHLHAHDDAIQACSDSLELLGLDRIDVVLLHSPNPKGTYLEAWKALIDLRKHGTIRSIGVSNFSVQQLASIVEDSGVVPAIHQVALHPLSVPAEVCAQNARLNMVTQSWNPLESGSRPIPDPAVDAAATAHGVTPDQVVLRWHLQLGVVPLPMAKARPKQEANLDLFDFELSRSEMAGIYALSRTNQPLPTSDQTANPGV